MDLITFAVTVALIGFLVWLLVTYVPMPVPIRTALVVVVALVIVLWAIRAFVGPIPVVR
jgi:hypothetical protein